MIRKTALLTGIAGAMLMAAPAMAQDPMNPTQTPPSTTQTPSTSTPPAPAGALQLQPGANVRGSDGSTLGQLEGVRNNDAGEQELTVRGADGQLRGVPLSGLSQQGADVAVAWTTAEFQAAPTIAADPSTAPASSPETPGAMPSDTTPPASAPMNPMTPPASTRTSPPASEPMTPPSSDPTTPPDGAAPPPTEPQN